MTKIWRETGFVENDPWVIETEEVKASADDFTALGGVPEGLWAEQRALEARLKG